MPRAPRPLSLAAVVAAALLITGCASAAPTASSPSPTPSPTQSPTPTPEPVLTPTVAFDGDCSQLLSDSDLDGFLGDGWLTQEESDERWDIDRRHPAFIFNPLGTIGGLECWWYPAEAEDGLQQLSVTVAPAAEVPASFTNAFSEPRCEGNYDGSSCYLARTMGDAWLMATVGNLIEEPPVDLLEGMLDAAGARLSQPLDAVAVSHDGWWTLPTCEDFGVEMGLGEQLGDGYVTGFWEGTESPEQIMLREGGIALSCEWSTGDVSTTPDGEFRTPSLDIANGAHWQWADLAALDGAEEVAVEGAESAVLVPDPERPSVQRLFATDGTNVIQANVADADFLVLIAERAFAALG
ncbi:hypothetical protein LJR045_000061 [Microbacterium sp. LjRoot45]|uniref:hypothetical protein n=1 Tax=Microbacterium sp. LjRoot45 TaxID=3342329 RepID=UPI003ECDB8DA